MDRSPASLLRLYPVSRCQCTERTPECLIYRDVGFRMRDTGTILSGSHIPCLACNDAGCAA